MILECLLLLALMLEDVGAVAQQDLLPAPKLEEELRVALKSGNLLFRELVVCRAFDEEIFNFGVERLELFTRRGF